MLRPPDGDDEERACAALAAAHRSLLAGVQSSRALHAALSRSAPRLSEIKSRLPSLQSSVRPARAPRAALAAACKHIDRAVAPAAAALKVFDAVHGVEPPLVAGPGAGAGDLDGYLNFLGQLEAALRFLDGHCTLAVQWLKDIVEYLSDNALADPAFLASLSRTLDALKDVSDKSVDLDGGLLSVALSKLELEFNRLLADYDAAGRTGKLPASVVVKFTAIIGTLRANGRLDHCAASYVDMRAEAVAARMKALGLDYLADPGSDAQALGPDVELWAKHLEFTVRHILGPEHKLCTKLFAACPDDGAACFAEITSRAGMLQFVEFGRAVANAKKVPVKLLRLLDVFDVLNKLRGDFIKLFGSKACSEIQSRTRDLVKCVIDGAAEIFDELLLQVELQRYVPPPADGTAPSLVALLADFCNRLVSDGHRSVLIQVLFIHRSWRDEFFNEKLLITAITNILKALEMNFDAWAKHYEDAALSYLFLMNAHWEFFNRLHGTPIGELLGEMWLREHEQFKDYYATIFLRETWGNLTPLLSREGLVLFSQGRESARELIKKRFKVFNEQFSNMYQRHSTWVILDKDLREKTCSLIVQTIVPLYRSYMQNYGPLVEHDENTKKYIRYSAESLEKMLCSLFLPKPRRLGSLQVRHSNGKTSGALIGMQRSLSTVR